MGEFYFDINEIINFINNTNEDNSTNEISEMYSVDGDGNLQLVNAQMNKTTNKNDSNSAIKYDLIKNFMGQLFTETENPTTTQAMVFNTFLAYNFIKKK